MWVSLAPHGYSRYELSTLGRVRTLNYTETATGAPAVMHPGLSSGYLTLCLTSDTGRNGTVHIHRLACLVWNGAKPTPSHVACHRNDIKTDNTPQNLVWQTRSENGKDAYRNGAKVGGSTPSMWGSHGTLSVATVRAMRARYAAGEKMSRIAAAFDVNYHTARNAILGINYGWVGTNTAEQQRIRSAALATRKRVQEPVQAEREELYQAALDRAAPPAVVKRKKTPHTPAAKAPTSKGSN